jgi:hypothetical protein
MVTRFPPDRLRRNSDRPTAITDVLVASSPSGYRTTDILLGTPTCSARTRHGLWALYPNGADVVVVWPGGAITGSPAEVARELATVPGRLGGHRRRPRRDELDRAAARAIGQFLTDPAAKDATVWPAIRARTWSSPAVGYRISGPANQPGHGNQQPSSWPGAPAHRPRSLVALPGATSPDKGAPNPARPDPSPKPAPRRAA